MKNSFNKFIKTSLLIFLLVSLTAFSTELNSNDVPVSNTELDYPGTNLRGKIVNINEYPLGGLQVTLWVQNAYGWHQLAYTFSDVYGFYYFQYVQPGYYTIQVNGVQNYNIEVVQIDYNYYAFQDLPLFYF